MMEEEVDQITGYHAYLLRLWRDDETMPWRATLEDPHSGRLWAFASLARLFAHLLESTGTLSQLPGPGGQRS